MTRQETLASVDHLPVLPMDLPVMLSPTSATVRPVPAPSPVENSPRMILIDAADLTIDDRFGLDTESLAARYAAEVADARERLASGQPQVAYPAVVASGDGRYIAYTAIPVAIAALDLARASNTAIMVSVLVCRSVDGKALLDEMFAKPRGRSLFEKARYIIGCESKYGTRRAWMRAEGIMPEVWEPRFSKIAKIAKLDDWLLSRIDPHSISNAEVASRIVDAWRDPAKRRIITDLTTKAIALAKGPIKAGPLFKRIDAALHPVEARVTASAWSQGACDLLATDGTCIAKLTRDETGWSIGGSDLASLDRATLTAALDVLKG
jgi:hypothetical protein